MADPCQPIVDRLAALQAQRRGLQDELRTASPSEKRFLVQQIRQMGESIRAASAELATCRRTNPAPLRPDIGFQLSTCLPDNIRPRFEQALREAFSEMNGEAHSTCIDGTERVGIWLPSVGEAGGRLAGLEFVNPPRRAGESFSQSISAPLIRRTARAEWDARPKAYNSDGDPDPTGPVFLTGFSFRMQPPDRVVTTTDGFRRISGPLPDVEFTASTIDTLDAEGGAPHCDSTTEVDADFDELSFLLELFLGGPLGVVRSLFRMGADIWDSTIDPGQQGGVGCGALALFPARINLDAGISAELDYRRVEVTRAGAMLAGGTIEVSS